MRTNTARRVVGRLLEVVVDAGYGTVADVDAMIAAIAAELAAVPPETRVVIVADWRGCRLMSPDAADRALRMLTGNNARIEKSALLTNADSSVAVLQFLRLVRESHHPDRRVFGDAAAVAGFLGPSLDDDERRRLDEVLARVPPA